MVTGYKTRLSSFISINVMEFIRAHKTVAGSSQPFQSWVPHFLPLASVGAGLKCSLTPGLNFSQAGPTLCCNVNCTMEKAEQIPFFSLHNCAFPSVTQPATMFAAAGSNIVGFMLSM